MPNINLIYNNVVHIAQNIDYLGTVLGKNGCNAHIQARFSSVGRRFSPYKVLDYVNKALIFKQLFMFLDPPVTAFLHMGAKLCFYPMAIKKI